MLADAAEAGSHDGSTHEGIPTDNPAFCKYFHTIYEYDFHISHSAALRNLSSLYRKQGRAEAADILEKAAKGSRGERVTNQGKSSGLIVNDNISVFTRSAT